MNYQIKGIKHVKENDSKVLYAPLRNTLLKNTTKQSPRVNQQQLHDQILKISKLSPTKGSKNKILSPQKIRQEVIIPDQVQLDKTNNFQVLPKNTIYHVVDYSRKTGEPIGPNQLHRRLSSKNDNQQVVVYEYSKNKNFKTKQSQTYKYTKYSPQPYKQANEMERYSFKRKSKKQKVAQPTYNLFSFLDEPFNNLIHGLKCTCPANQLIAEKINEMEWQIEEKQ